MSKDKQNRSSGRRVKRNGRSKENKRHVRFHYWMMNSDAFRSLSPFEARLLLELYGLYNGRNNGYFFLSCREAARRCNMGKNTANRAFKALIDMGFIRRRADEPEQYNLREANYWILTEFEFGTQPASKAFMRWQPEQNS